MIVGERTRADRASPRRDGADQGSAASRDHDLARAPSARFRPRRQADGGGVPLRDRPDCENGSADDRHAQRSRADGRLPRPVVARLPAQQWGRGATETSAAILGPFWRMHSSRTENGGSLVRSPTPGAPFFFIGHVRDRTNQPIVGAEVDVWHSSTSGLYESQDSEQADMNLRGKFTTDETGTFSFRSIKPAGYPIPTNGNVVGQLLDAQGRHPFRPAHVHFLMVKARIQGADFAGLHARR